MYLDVCQKPYKSSSTYVHIYIYMLVCVCDIPNSFARSTVTEKCISLLLGTKTYRWDLAQRLNWYNNLKNKVVALSNRPNRTSPQKPSPKDQSRLIFYWPIFENACPYAVSPRINGPDCEFCSKKGKKENDFFICLLILTKFFLSYFFLNSNQGLSFFFFFKFYSNPVVL